MLFAFSAYKNTAYISSGGRYAVKLKAQSSKLKAQSSKKLKTLFNKPLIKSLKGFTLLELIITISILGIVSAIAVPNFTTMVQNNRIKSTTNHIVSSLQFARQTAVIEQTQVTACTPVPGNPENCALSRNWQNGVALLQGKAKVDNYTPPPPPSAPQKTAGPTKPIKPPYPAKPAHPGYPAAPSHPGYPSKPQRASYPPKPVKSAPPKKPVIYQPQPPRLVPVPPITPKPSDVDAGKHAHVIGSTTITTYTSSSCNGGREGRVDGTASYHCNTFVGSRGFGGYSIYYESVVDSDTCMFPGQSVPATKQLRAAQNCRQAADNYNNGIAQRQADYNRKMQEHEQSKSANAAAIKTNQDRQAAYQREMNSYPQRVRDNDAQHQRNLQAHEANYQAQVRAWENEKSRINSRYESDLSDWRNDKRWIDNRHSSDMNRYYQQRANIDNYYQNTTLPNWERQKANTDKAHQQAINRYNQQVIDHENAWLKQLNDHDKAMEKYHDDRTKDPSLVVTMEQAKRLLANNVFASSVIVTPELNAGVTAVVYNKDQVKNGHGKIYIEDKRGRGEHSRTICINMLGNLKVVKGNEDCR